MIPPEPKGDTFTGSMTRITLYRTTTMKADKLNDLDQFTGGGDQYRNTFGLLYTEGVRYLAEHAECYWLIDVIDSHQPDLRKDADLVDFQVWELIVNPEDRTSVVTCRADSGRPPAGTQKIPWSDFPLPTITLWVENGVLLLPSEH